jgi:PadR family transcriptional regulator, regulatory protein PadR
VIPKALGAASVRPFILSLLARQDTYGYQIIQYAKNLSDGSLDLQPGILYPILRRLENDRLIESYWVTPVGDRKRRYYKLTDKGKGALEVEKREWFKMHDTFTRLWNPAHV